MMQGYVLILLNMLSHYGVFGCSAPRETLTVRNVTKAFVAI